MSELLQYLLTGLATGATYALVGLGIALVVQVTGVINFAQGEFVMLGALSYAMLGSVRPTGGQVRLDGARIDALRPDRLAHMGITRTFQHLETFGSLSALDNVLVPLEARGRQGGLRPAGPGPAPLRRTAAALLAAVGVTDRLHAPVSALPQGTRCRVELARALAGRPRLLLLDEPLAGLSREEGDRLAAVVRRVADTGVTVLLVEHDVPAIMRTSDRVVVLDHGRLLADGPPARVEVDQQVRTAYLGMEPQR